MISDLAGKLPAGSNPLRDIFSDGYRSSNSGYGVSITKDLDESYPPPKFDEKTLKLWWGGSWLRHQKSRFRRFAPLGPPFYSYSEISNDKFISTAEKGELLRFLLTLELWERTPGDKEISAQTVWIQSLSKGPDYAKELDDLFSLSWREKDRDSYNFIFPSRFLPRWEEETDDLLLSAESTFADEGTLEEFRITLSDLLDEIDWKLVRLPSDDEIKFDRSTTSSYVHSLGKTMPHWQASLGNDHFATTELIGLRCKVPVYPGGTRDTIISDISANYSVRWLERTMRHILEYVPESADSLYSSTFRNRLENVVYSEGYHVFRDIKKCGITYNVKQLFPILKEEISKRLPDRRFNRFDIFNSLQIVDPDGFSFEAQRGYGLGMANHTVTLCNIVVHRMARNSLTMTFNKRKFVMKAIFGNDDADVCFVGMNKYSLTLAEEYLAREHDIHSNLGNLTNFKKSVVKSFGLFYETYSKRGWIDKESLVCNAIACAYLAPNVRVAKHYIYSQSERFQSKWAQRELYFLAKHWDGEFYSFRDELYVNFEIGGWLNTTSCGLKTTLRDIEYLEDKNYRFDVISYAYSYCSEFVKTPKPIFKTQGMVHNHMYDGAAKKSSALVQLYTLTDHDLIDFYKRLTTFQRNYSKRMENFKKRVLSKRLCKTKREIFEKLLENPWYTIPDSLVTYHTRQFEARYSYEDELYRYDDDPISSLLKGEDLFTFDDVFTWDPKIHPIDMKILPSSQWQMMFASQFSNSGFLPTLEYHLRKKANPVCELVGRIRHPPTDKQTSTVDKGVQKHKYVFRPKKIVSFHGHEAELTASESEEEHELEEPDQTDYFKLIEEDLISHGHKVTPKNIEPPPLEIKEEIDDQAYEAMMQRALGEYTSTSSYPSHRQEPETSVWDEDDDEPMDFSFME